jgi:hypothetical protein
MGGFLLFFPSLLVWLKKKEQIPKMGVTQTQDYRLQVKWSAGQHFNFQTEIQQFRLRLKKLRKSKIPENKASRF